MNRREAVCLLLFGSVIASLAADDGPTPEATRSKSAVAIERGIDWLLSRQHADGSWRSETYSAFGEGPTVSALVVRALAEVPLDEIARTEGPYRRGIAFLLTSLDAQGIVNDPADGDVHAIYSTALLLSALNRREADVGEAVRTRLAQALVRQQSQADPLEAGGWRPGQSDSKRPSRGDALPANVSATVHVLEALRGCEEINPDVFEAAIRFLDRCRHPVDHGFFFTPRADHPLNKGGWQRNDAGELVPRSYLSATCDGYLAGLHCGEFAKGPSQEQTLTALCAWPVEPYPDPGDSPDSEFSALQGVYFYRTAAWAQVWSSTHDPRLAESRRRLLKELTTAQQDDGAWASPLAWMYENDPLIATSWSVLAMARLQSDPALLLDRP